MNIDGEVKKLLDIWKNVPAASLPAAKKGRHLNDDLGSRVYACLRVTASAKAGPR